jgi:hypothetical protein
MSKLASYLDDKATQRFLAQASEINSIENLDQLILGVISATSFERGELLSHWIESGALTFETVCSREHLDDIDGRSQDFAVLQDLVEVCSATYDKFIKKGMEPNEVASCVQVILANVTASFVAGVSN